MSKTIEEIKTKELLGKAALANGYSCIAEMSVTMSDKDIRIAVLKYQLDESQSQTQELQEQNAELVGIIYTMVDEFENTSKSSSDILMDGLKKTKELLTKHSHLNKKP